MVKEDIYEYRDTPMLNGKQEDMRKGSVNR